MIDIRLLNAATTVAEERNVTRAAERLALTQPALTKQLQELESRLGYSLFERTSQRFLITEAGAAFVEHARKALEEIELAVHTGRSASLGCDSIICVAKSAYVDPYFASVMRSVRLPLHPGLALRFATHFSLDALSLVRSGGADLGLTNGVSEPIGLTTTLLGEDPLYVLFHRDSDLCSRRELTIHDFHGRALILPERHVNAAVYDRLRQLMDDQEVRPSSLHHVQQAEEAAAFVLQCGSVALLTKTGAWRVLDSAMSLRPLKDERLFLRTYLSARLEERSPMIADFVRSLMRRLLPKSEQRTLALTE